MGVLVESRLAIGRTEVEGLVPMFRSQLRLLLVHHHSAYRVFLHQFTSLELPHEYS